MVLIAPSADIADDNQLQNMTIKMAGLGINTLTGGNQTGCTLVFYNGSVLKFVSILRSIKFIGNDLASPQSAFKCVTCCLV